MYNIHIYSSDAQKLFDYKSNVLPMIGDIYAGQINGTDNYIVTKRLLHTSDYMTDTITVWVEKTGVK